MLPIVRFCIRSIFVFVFSLMQHPLSFSPSVALEEMADETTVAEAIHCGGVSSRFIFSLVCGGRRRTGCLRLQNKGIQ